jgi:branched-chain amino acid transport system permease protein
MIGGMGSIYGAVLGTLFIVLMENLFIPLFEDSLSKYMYLETGDFQAFMFGLIMLIFIIFQPLGFYGMWLKMKIYWKIFPFNPRKRFI